MITGDPCAACGKNHAIGQCPAQGYEARSIRPNGRPVAPFAALYHANHHTTAEDARQMDAIISSRPVLPPRRRRLT